jgi:hypothetical protein
MWYGRRQEKYKCHIENLQEHPIKSKLLSQNQNPQITV